MRLILTFFYLMLAVSAHAALGPGMQQRAITINGAAPNFDQLAVFEQAIQMQIPNGAYWYDAQCGASGMMGGPCTGFLPAGLQIATAPLPANASGQTNTGVFVNGRELHLIDIIAMNQILAFAGGQCMPGRWWCDAAGNMGPEGGPAWLNFVQLMALAQQHGGGQFGGGGGGGDNFWSSRFSAGNSSGGAGYVSVPGHGPVGYGM